MTAIYRRELQSYFHSPVGYVFMSVFLAIASAIFCLQNLQNRSGDLLTFLGQLSYMWMLLSPVLTMRLLAEERRARTDQLLLTSPVSLTGIVLGKYLAAVTVMLLTVALTGLYVGIVAAYGTVYPGELLAGYLGFVTQGCAFLALDMMVSGLCRSTVSAAVAAFGLNLALWMLDLLQPSLSGGAAEAIAFVSLYTRNEPFWMGQLSFASILYNLSVAAAALLLTVWNLNRRRN